jgi:hypothetical protein
LVDLTGRRRVAGLALGGGILVVVLARVFVPGAPPLYDGVVINEPYKWLEPPQGEQGGAQGVSDTAALENGASPLIALATPEQPPQAQVFAPPGALVLPAGTTSLLMAITPIPAEGTPASGQIAGNVYRITITNQDGVPTTAPPQAYVSVVMRGPDNLLEATMARFKDGVWQPLETSHAGYTSGFLSIVTEFGDFALIAPGGTATPSANSSASVPPGETPATEPPTTPGTATATGDGVTYSPLGEPPNPLVLILLGAGAVGVVGGALLIYRSMAKPLPPPRRGGGRRRRR